jgi:hypothetical protein
MLVTFAALAFGAPPTPEELLAAADDVGRGDQSYAVLSMEVHTARYDRTMKMEAWSKGTETSLIRILEPEKDAGVATLKVDGNIWNYLPKVDRTMKVPAGLMSGSWMGSHFSNDDLVRENRMSEDFTFEVTTAPSDVNAPTGVWTITCVPKPDAAVVWGKVVVDVRTDKVPVSIRYFDEKGVLMRTMAFSDVKEIGGRLVPATMTLTPADLPGEQTVVRYEKLDFDVTLDDAKFSLQALRP